MHAGRESAALSLPNNLGSVAATATATVDVCSMFCESKLCVFSSIPSELIGERKGRLLPTDPSITERDDSTHHCCIHHQNFVLANRQNQANFGPPECLSPLPFLPQRTSPMRRPALPPSPSKTNRIESSKDWWPASHPRVHVYIAYS